MKKIYNSIDIGTDTIKFLTEEEYNNKFYVLASKDIKTKGIRKGLIIDSNLVVNSIKDGLKEINEQLGFDIKKVITNVPEYNAKFMYVTGKIDINDIITSEDINKVIKESIYNKIEEDYELVTVLPIEFTINDESTYQEVINLPAKTLEIKGIMITVPKKNIYSVISVLEGAGLEPVDITLSGIADYAEVRNKNLDNQVGAIINIGHETTNVSIINQGTLMSSEIIQLGGANIENDIAYVFGSNVIDARKIKEKFACANKRFTNLNEIYELTNNIGEVVKLNQLEVTEVVMSRLTEILNYAKKQITLLTKRDVNYIIITGGQTEIKSFKNLVYEILGKDVIIYLMDDIGIRDNKFITASGMIKYFKNKMNIRGKECSMISEDDEQKLLNPEEKKKKENPATFIFKGFNRNKEEK